jgi:two-component system OmpR family response regulator
MVQAIPHLLVVDDDIEICRLLSRFLSVHGLRVTIAQDGDGMRRMLSESIVDLMILDIMLGQEDGLSICRELRAASRIPIIFVTGMDSETDRVVGLEMGADDYLTKPFSPRELLARVRAVLRRTSTEPTTAEIQARPGAMKFSGWVLNTSQHLLLAPNGSPVDLRPAEYEILLAFLNNPQTVLSRDELLQMTQGRPADSFDRSIDVQIARLRRKIGDDPKFPDIIKTVRKGGYILAAEVVTN